MQGGGEKGLPGGHGLYGKAGAGLHHGRLKPGHSGTPQQQTQELGARGFILQGAVASLSPRAGDQPSLMAANRYFAI